MSDPPEVFGAFLYIRRDPKGPLPRRGSIPPHVERATCVLGVTGAVSW